MHAPLRYVRTREGLAIVTLSALMTRFIGFLLLGNYSSYRRLREGALLQYQRVLDRRALDASHFLQDLRSNLTALLENGRLNVYFENRALGMSMQYGLGSAIAAVHRELSETQSQTRLGDRAVCRRLAFFDSTGHAIADTVCAGPSPGSERAAPAAYRGLAEGVYICQGIDPANRGLVLALPSHFKGVYQGHLVVWLDRETVVGEVIVRPESALYTCMLCPPSRFLDDGTECPAASAASGTPALCTEAVFAQRRQVLADDQEVLVLHVPVGATGLALAEIAPKRAVLGATSPATLLVVMALLGCSLAAAAVYFARMTAVNMILLTRVEESGKREIAVAEKNRQLTAEIEERKRAEAERLRHESQLQRAQEMEAIGLLAAGVAHDPNNILCGLVTYPQLVLPDVPKDSPVRSAMLSIQQSGVKAAAVVQDMLTLARRGVPPNEVVNLNRVVNDYLTSPQYHQLLEAHRGIQVCIRLTPDLANIQGSPVHLAKAVMNLFQNAVEAMPDGGEIEISTCNQSLPPPSAATIRSNRAAMSYSA